MSTIRCSPSEDSTGHGSAFQSLVRRLCDEHDQEVGRLQAKLNGLRSEVEALHFQLQGYGGGCTVGDLPGFSLSTCEVVEEKGHHHETTSSCERYNVKPKQASVGLCDDNVSEDEETPAPKPKLQRKGTGALVGIISDEDDDEDHDSEDEAGEGEEPDSADEGDKDADVFSQHGKATSRVNDTVVGQPLRGAWSDENDCPRAGDSMGGAKEISRVWPASDEERIAPADMAAEQPPLKLGLLGQKKGLKMSVQAKAVVDAPKPNKMPVHMPHEDPPQLESVVPTEEVSLAPLTSNGTIEGNSFRGSQVSARGLQDPGKDAPGGFLKPFTDAVKRLSGHSNTSFASGVPGADGAPERKLSARASAMFRDLTGGMPSLRAKKPEVPTNMAPTSSHHKTQRISWHISVEEQTSENKAKLQKYKVRQRWLVDERTLIDMKRKESNAELKRKESASMTLGKDDPSASRKTLAEETSNSIDLLLSRIQQKPSWADKFVTTPNSRFNFMWDIVSMALIGYDVVMIPFDVFDPDDTIFTNTMAFITGIFWILDIFRTFFTGYYKKGDIIMRFRLVAKNYLLSWFCIDSAIVTFDWTYIISKYSKSNAGQVGGFQKHVRSLRSARGLRLLRGVKMARIIKTIEDRFTSERNSVLFNVLMLFIGLVLLNHAVACIWYFIGKTFKGSSVETWIDQYLTSEDDIWYRYFTSFHWALTQFTPASIAVQPHNVYERLFGVIVLLFALVSVSSFVSGITSAVMFLRNLGSAKSKQFWLLRRYLRESKVPTQLALQIQRYCDFAWQSRETRLQEKSVQALGLLSESLRADLNTAILEPRLWSHPLFMLFSKLAPSVMNRLCNTAVSRKTLVRGDKIFQVGDERSCTDIIIGGSALYNHDQGDRPAELVEVDKESWINEIVLWSCWTCVGTVTTVTDCDVVSIDSDKFAQVIRSSEDTKLEAAVYARGFVHGLNHFSRVNDLFRNIAQIEGLWFRLMNEYQVKRSDGARRSTLQFQTPQLSTRHHSTIME